MNNQLIEELYKTIEAKDNIINNQALEISRLNNEIQLRIKSIEKLENDIIEYQRDRARLKTHIKTIKRNCKRYKAKLRNRNQKAIEYIKNACYSPEFNKDYLDNLLEILGVKECN